MAAVTQAQQHISEASMQELGRIIHSSDPGQRTVVEALEREFAEYTGARYAVAVSSGTAALHLALLAHGIGPRHEVITSPLCLPDVGTAVLATGARPVYADINPYTYTISPLAVEQALANCAAVPRSESRVLRYGLGDEAHNPQLPQLASAPSDGRGALLAIHLFGQPCDMAALSEIAGQHGLVLIEVAWDALGARYDHASVGSFGAACYSFLPGMAIVTGQGGMLTTDDEVVAATARRLANHGCDCHGRVREPGFNYRMSGVIAAMALQQLPHVAQHVELQRHWAGELTHGLCGLAGIIPPAETPGGMHAFQRYAIRITPEFPLSRDRVQQDLQAWSVTTPSANYLPLHQHPFHSTRRDKARSLSNAERVAQELLFLPMDPDLDTLTVTRVVRALRLMASCVAERDCPPRSGD